MVEYTFYKAVYQGGSIPQESWNTYVRPAEAQLAYYKRVYTVTAPDGYEVAEAMAVCAMAETLYNVDLIANGEGGVQSASIGSVSTSYGANEAVDVTPKGVDRSLYKAAKLFLEIYRGVG